MRKIAIAFSTLISVSSVAMAADLPSRRAPPVFVPPPIPFYTWTGFYVGGQVGYGFGQSTTTTVIPAVAAVGFPGAVTAGSVRPSGVIGGGHVGYNYEFPAFGFGSGLVIGIEGDVDGSDYSQTTTFGVGNGFFVTPGTTTTVRSEIQGSARGRLGVAFDRALFYATGGAAFADFHTSLNNVGVGSDSFSHSRVGYTVGGGVEYAITPQFSLRGEYRYTDFGSFSNTLVNSSLVAGTVSRYRETEERVQLGFSYKFDQPLAAPVVARY